MNTPFEIDAISTNDLVNAAREFSNAVELTEEETIMHAAIFAELEHRHQIVRTANLLKYTTKKSVVLTKEVHNV